MRILGEKIFDFFMEKELNKHQYSIKIDEFQMDKSYYRKEVWTSADEEARRLKKARKLQEKRGKRFWRAVKEEFEGICSELGPEVDDYKEVLYGIVKDDLDLLRTLVTKGRRRRRRVTEGIRVKNLVLMEVHFILSQWLTAFPKGKDRERVIKVLLSLNRRYPKEVDNAIPGMVKMFTRLGIPPLHFNDVDSSFRRIYSPDFKHLFPSRYWRNTTDWHNHVSFCVRGGGLHFHRFLMSLPLGERTRKRKGLFCVFTYYFSMGHGPVKPLEDWLSFFGISERTFYNRVGELAGWMTAILEILKSTSI